MEKHALRFLMFSHLVALLIVCSGCNGCGRNSHQNAEATRNQPKSFYERNSGAARVIVFVHGIFGSSRDTWSCSPRISWPNLLKDDDTHKDSDIYVVGYDTPYFGNRMTIDEIVSNLKSRLDSDAVFTKHREVVFVAHSLGGLIVQKLLLTHRETSKQVPFIYFYSTPETGAQIAALGHVFSSDPLLREMFPGDSNDYLLGLESEWRGAAFATIHRYCAYEKQPLSGVLVVDRLSGTRNCEKAIPINENHSTIVKPCDRNADSYIALHNALRENPIAPEKIPTTAIVENRKWMSYQQVDCNRTNSQTLTASVFLDPKYNEKAISATAALENADNIQEVKGPTLGAVTGNMVTVTYGFNGKDRDAFGSCPGGGHATVTVTFVVQKDLLPSVTFTVPVRSERSDSVGIMEGRVDGLQKPEDYKVVIYTWTDRWYVQPYIEQPLTDIDDTGRWRTSVHLGDEFAVLVVRPTYSPPIAPVRLPPTGGDVLALRRMPTR